MTREQQAMGVKLMIVIIQAVRKAGPMGLPEGHIYAAMMGVCTLPAFESLVQQLIGTNLVKRSGHVLTWIGE